MEHKLTHDEIQAIIDGRAFLIDVRSDKEVEEKACKSAIHWDVDQMIQGRFPDIPKEKPTFTFCRAGNRSSVAQSMMSAEGFTDVHNLGGMHNVPDELCG